MEEEVKDGVVLTNMSQERAPIAPRDKWPELSVNDLIDQRALIYDQWEWLDSKPSCKDIAKTIAQLYHDIDALIQSRV